MRGRKTLRSSETADDTGRRDGHRHGGRESDVLKEEIVGQAVLAATRELRARDQVRASWLPITHYPAFDPTRPVGVLSIFGPASSSISVTCIIPRPHRSHMQPTLPRGPGL